MEVSLWILREEHWRSIGRRTETQAKFEMLRDWGCDEGQGYLFDRPLGADDATARLQQGVYRR